MTQTSLNSHFDAVIVGARAAGAGTALCLARQGARVLVVDRDAHGSDRMSTHALMRSGVVQLARWGVLEPLMAEGTPPVTRTTFHYPDMSHGIDIKPDFGVGHLLAPRRTVLDRVLVDAARAAGAEVRHRTHMLGLLRGAQGRVTGVKLLAADQRAYQVTADIVIGADGRTSVVAEAAGAKIYHRDRHASGTVYGYFRGIRDDGFRWYFAKNAAAGVIPTNHGLSCVFASVPSVAFRETFKGDLFRGFQTILAHNAPELAEEIGRGTQEGRLTPFAGAAGFRRESHGPGWALVGDAGYFKDPATANGISDALRDAELLARAVLRGGETDLAAYQAERDAISAPLCALTDQIASCALSPQELRAAHKQLAKEMQRQAAFAHELNANLPAAA